MRASIAHTWDGRPLDASEIATVEMGWEKEALSIRVEAPWGGDPTPKGPKGPFWKLWEHEVVELFLLGQNEQYTEVELGPYGHHLVLRLQGVRSIVESKLPIEFKVTRREGRWSGHARLAIEHLPHPLVAFNAYAIRGTGRERRYMAHAPVPGDAPDFHRLSLFAPWPEALR